MTARVTGTSTTNELPHVVGAHWRGDEPQDRLTTPPNRRAATSCLRVRASQVPARRVLCCVNRPRYSHAVNTQRVRDRVWQPLSIANNSGKCLILGPARQTRSRSVSSGETYFRGLRPRPSVHSVQPGCSRLLHRHCTAAAQLWRPGFRELAAGVRAASPAAAARRPGRACACPYGPSSARSARLRTPQARSQVE